MSNVVAWILAMLVFALVISVWNWLTQTLPGSASGGLNWIVFLVAAIIAVVVYLLASRR